MIRRTAAITAASIVGVILAGGAAVGANIGILNAADNNSLGNLSAVAPVTTPAVEPTTTLLSVVRASDPTGPTQSFIVDLAGTVEVKAADTGLSLGDVRTNQGWSWEESDVGSGAVAVIFTFGTDKIFFSATPNDDGTISARVDRPAITPALTSPPKVNSSATYSDDHHDDDHGNEGGEDDD